MSTKSDCIKKYTIIKLSVNSLLIKCFIPASLWLTVVNFLIPVTC